MEINAVAYYKYDTGYIGWECLQLVVKFRYGKRFFRRKWIRTVASMKYVENLDWRKFKEPPYETKDEYYEYINSVLDNPEFKREMAEEMINDWIKEQMEESNQNSEIANILKKVKSDGKMKIKLNVK
ncbi:hypothetical protein GCM10008931_43830 [Oceanobacillus oncorhynchi subsp. oncorhynchi]|uniref:hypothetical protein n=1 Tax=Oceanobacillus oncorhynchi TaxID=545501 RepID=UPI0031E02C3F